MNFRPVLTALPWFRIWDRGGRYFWLALFLSAATIFSLKTGEHYPFSNFPMYGNPNPRPVDYYFLTNQFGEPLPVAQLTGDTAPKLKKRLNTEFNEYCEANKIRTKLLIPEDVRAEITKGVLDSFVAQSMQRGTPLPPRVQLWRGEIHVAEDGYHETFIKEAEN